MPRNALTLFACLLALFMFSAPALAQDAVKDKPAAPAEAPDKPKKVEAPAASQLPPVSVEHNDADVVGTRLAYQVKELIGRSSLMRLSSKDEKKIALVLKTAEEFTGRPAVSSIYTAIWLYSAKTGSLRYYLTSQTGIADAATLDATVESILTQTDKVAETYSYLFQ